MDFGLFARSTFPLLPPTAFTLSHNRFISEELGVCLIQPCRLVVAEGRELINQLRDGGLEASHFHTEQGLQQTRVFTDGGTENPPLVSTIICTNLTLCLRNQQILRGLSIHLPHLLRDEWRINHYQRKSVQQLRGERLRLLKVIRNEPRVPRPSRVKVQQPGSLARSGRDAEIEGGSAEEGDFSTRCRGLLLYVRDKDYNGMWGVPVLVQVCVLYFWVRASERKKWNFA